MEKIHLMMDAELLQSDAEEFFKNGVDVITSGNHVIKKKLPIILIVRKDF